MSRLVKVATGPGDVFFDVDEAPGPKPLGRDKTRSVVIADEQLDKAIEASRPAVEAALDALTRRHDMTPPKSRKRTVG